MRFPPVVTLALTALLVTSLLVVATGVIVTAPTAGAQESLRSTDLEVDSHSYSHSHVHPSALSDSTSRSLARSPAFASVSAASSLTPADPSQVTRIDLAEDGNATWTLETRFLLDTADDEAVEDFYAYAEAVAADEREDGYDVEEYETYVEYAAESTERGMRLENVTWNDPHFENVSESTPQLTPTNDNSIRVGVISMRFTWTNFTEVDGNRVHLGDVFRTDDGTWFSWLEESQRLVINAPPNYAYEHAPRAPRDGALVWNGPHEFGANDLYVIYLEGTDSTPPTTSPPTDDPPSTDDPDPGSGGDERSWTSLLATGLGVLVVSGLVGTVGYFLVQNRSDDEPDGTESVAALESAPETDPDTDTTPSAAETDSESTNATQTGPEAEAALAGSTAGGDQRAESSASQSTPSASDADAESEPVVSTFDEDERGPDGETAASETTDTETEADSQTSEDGEVGSDADTDTDSTPDSASQPAEDADDEVDVELLSDEERVHRLLRENNGRMKQASIVTETDWSNAKVSQLLSKMDESGDIEKLRIGRENLITHPDVDPTEID